MYFAQCPNICFSSQMKAMYFEMKFNSFVSSSLHKFLIIFVMLALKILLKVTNFNYKKIVVIVINLQNRFNSNFIIFFFRLLCNVN